MRHATARLRQHRILEIATPEAFTIEEAAHRLGFRHRSSVYDLISRGDLIACRIGGGSLRVPADAIVDYLQRAIDQAADVKGGSPYHSGLNPSGTSTDLCRQPGRSLRTMDSGD